MDFTKLELQFYEALSYLKVWLETGTVSAWMVTLIAALAILQTIRFRRARAKIGRDRGRYRTRIAVLESRLKNGNADECSKKIQEAELEITRLGIHNASLRATLKPILDRESDDAWESFMAEFG